MLETGEQWALSLVGGVRISSGRKLRVLVTFRHSAVTGVLSGDRFNGIFPQEIGTDKEGLSFLLKIVAGKGVSSWGEAYLRF